MKGSLIEIYHKIENEYLDYMIELAERAINGDIEDEIQQRQEFFVDKLLENGVIVPPCKVGDTVYLLKFNTVIMCKVETIYCGIGIYLRLKPCFQPYVGNHSIYYKVAASRFSKTVFLTSEAAERALKERDG